VSVHAKVAAIMADRIRILLALYTGARQRAFPA